MAKLPTRASLEELWVQDYAPRDLCCICGNRGIIDTRGKVFAASGVECGALVFCICPNGQAMKKANGGQPRTFEATRP